MTLEEQHEFLNFWINKFQGSYYSPPELDEVIDRGQMALFAELRPIYATSQRIQDALAHFLGEYEFTPSDTVSGTAVIPSNIDYLSLLDVQVSFGISNRTVYAGVPVMNKNERANALNSQTDPVTTTSPICEVVAPRYIRFYPAAGYTGRITYFRRPAKPNFVYDTISGRVIVYNAVASTQLEWPEDWQNAVLLKALSSVGINMSEQDVTQWAEIRNQNNAQNQNNY
jgi:hypothetical protein